MIYRPNRNHFSYAVKQIIKFIKNVWVFGVIALTTGIKSPLFLGFIAILVLSIIFIIIEWRKTIFYIKDNILVLEKGVISTSKQEVPFDKINTIDSSQSLIDRIFKVYTLKVDTGSVIAKKSEFLVIVKKERLDELKNSIIDKDNKTSPNLSIDKDKEPEVSEEVRFNKDTEEHLVNRRVITSKEIFKYALTKSKIFWAIGGFFALTNGLDDILKYFHLKIFNSVVNYINLNSIQSKSVFIIILAFIILSVFVYIIIVVASVIFEMIRLNNFTVETYKDKISISYGLFTKKQYSFKLNKVYGIRFKQTLLQQFMNIGVLELITVGYGDEKDEKAILYPIIDEKSKEDFLKTVLSDMIFEGEMVNPPKSSSIAFILKGIIIPVIILVPTYIFLKIVPNNVKLSVILIVLVLSFIASLLNYKNTSLGTSKNVLIASSGGLSKVTTIIREEAVQSITKKQGIFQNRVKVCSYKIDLYSNKLGDVINVKYINQSLYNKIQENLKF